MIRVEPDPLFTPLSPPEVAELEREILNSYPYPLAVSYGNLRSQRDPTANLSVLLKDVLSTVLQYLALVMLQDYAGSTLRRSYRLFGFIESMIYQAGPGKWLGFLREVHRHYSEAGVDAAIPGLFPFLERHAGRKGTRLRLTLGDNGSPQTAPTLEALVTIRNRWAHSRHMAPEEAAQLADTMLLVVRHLYRDLAFLRRCPLTALLPESAPLPLEGARLPEALGRTPGPIPVRLTLPAPDRQPMRLFIHHRISKEKPEVLLFEELIEDRQALFCSSFHGLKFSRSKPEQKPLVEEVAGLMDRVRAEDEGLTLDRTTFRALSGRMNRLSAQICSDFRQAGKYEPESYVPPAGFVGHWREFLDSPATVLLVSGEQGRGKSALAAHWVETALEGAARTESQDLAVLFLEASRANAYAKCANLLERWFAESLGTDPKTSLLNYFEAALAEASPDARLVLVLDAVNEFETVERIDRVRLLRDLLNLAEKADDSDLLRGRVKFLFTLRWEAFEHVGYSLEQFEAEHRRSGSFYDPGASGRLLLELPPIDDPGLVYERLKAAGLSGSPRFGWEEIPEPLREGLCNPMLLKIFLAAYDDCQASELRDRSWSGFESRFVDRLFTPQKRDSQEERGRKIRRAAVVLDVLKEMKSSASQFLRLDTAAVEKRQGLAKVLEHVTDRARMEEGGGEHFSPYLDLVEQKVIREDIVRSPGPIGSPPLPARRISFTHELVTRHLVRERRRLDRVATERFGWKLWIPTFLVMLLIGYVGIFAAGRTGDWRLWVSWTSVVMLVGAVVLGVGFGFRIKYWLKDQLHTRAYRRLDVLDAFERFSAGERERLFVGAVASALTFALLAGFLVVAVRLFRGDLSGDFYILLYAYAVGPAGVAFLLITSVFSNLDACSLPSTRFLRSKTAGRHFLTLLFDAVYGAGLIVISFMLMHTGLNVLGRIQLAYGDPSFSQTVVEAHSLPILGFPDILIWPWLFPALLLPRPAIGLPLLWFKERRARQGKPWPQDPITFRQKSGRYLVIGAWVLFPLLVLSPVLLISSPSLDLGGSPISIAGSDDAVRIRNGLLTGLQLAPEALGAAEAASVTRLDGLRPHASTLESLWLEQTGVADLSVLQELEKVEVLRLHRNPKIENFAPVGWMQSLRELALEGSEVDDYAAHALFKGTRIAANLEVLVLFGTRISDWSVLASLPGLKALTLGESEIEPRTSLGESPDIAWADTLETLWLRDSPLQSDLSFFANLAGLQILRVEGPSSPLPPLGSCRSLQEVTLQDTAIEDLRPLLDAPALKKVHLDGQEIDPETHSALLSRGVAVQIR